MLKNTKRPLPGIQHEEHMGWISKPYSKIFIVIGFRLIAIGFIHKSNYLLAAASAADLQNSMDGRLDDSMLASCGLAGLPVGPWKT